MNQANPAFGNLYVFENAFESFLNQDEVLLTPSACKCKIYDCRIDQKHCEG
jgi:hypothetical protein